MAVLASNADRLVQIAVCGEVAQPAMRYPGYIADSEGRSQVLAGMAGVAYNARVGDAAFGWAADHVEPGVSIANPHAPADYALHYLSCIGNRARVTSGLAAGAEGVVTGEHARLLVDFPPEVCERLCIGDRVQVIAHGRGLRLVDFPRIELKKFSPALLERMPLQRMPDGRLRVPVTMTLPPRIMGSGAELNADFVDQDLMSGDRALMAELGIDRMRLGDLVAIPDAEHRWGRGYRAGAVTITLCIHGDSVMSGHGPGMLALMSGPAEEIAWVIDPRANIANWLQIRETS